MRPTVRVFLGLIALLSVFTLAGCENPLDPVDKSDEIQGLTWVEIGGASVEQWDSDPGDDGLEITLSYKNEFGEELSFHDKEHNIVIEFWTQKNIGTDTSPLWTRGQLFYSQTIEYENSDDAIRIPYEAYMGQLETIFDFTDEAETYTGMVVVRVFPPKEDPRPELLVAQADVQFYIPPVVVDGTP